MGERTHPDNCLWIFFCCGGLPILGIIKGIIIVGPIFVISLFGFSGIAFVLLPLDIFLTYKAICKTSIIGINLKILIILLLPIAFISWPFLVVIGGSIFGFFYGLFCPTVRTFDNKYHIIFGGFIDVFKDIFHFINSFWELNYLYFSYLEKDIEKGNADKPFDINFIQIIIGLILAVYGSVVCIIGGCLMWFIKLIPSIYKLYYNLLKLYCELKCLEMFMYSIIFLLAFIFTPVGGVLTILGYIGFGFFGGFFCAIEGYKHNIGRGIISIWIILRQMDYISNDIIFEKEFSCLPNCEDKCLQQNEHKIIEEDINLNVEKN